MSVHRWRLRRIIGWLVPVLAYLCVLVIMTSAQRDIGERRAFASDEAYRSLVVANVLKEAHTYGVYADQPTPMIQDMLWRVTLAAAQVIIPDGVTALRILGMLFGVLTLLLLIRLCHVIFPYPLFAHYTAALVIVAPGLAYAAISGLALPLAMCLVTIAVVRQLEDVTGPGAGLPLASTLFIGLAMWIRVEFIIVWALLLLHTLALGMIPGERRLSLLNTALRGLNGLLVLSLLLLPVLAWNMRVLQVPWPRLPGVPMAADVWAMEGATAAWGATVGLMREAWGEGFSRFGAWALPATAWARTFFWVGMLSLVVQAFRSREERPYAVLLLATPVCVPLLFGIAYPYVGWMAFPVIAASFLPVMLAIVAYGVVRLPFIVEGLAHKWIPKGLSTQHVFMGWWIGAGGLLLLFALFAQVRETRIHTRELRAVVEDRAMIGDAIEKDMLQRNLFITDRPGWLVVHYRPAVLDLSGEWSPELLRYVNMQGTYNIDRVSRHIEELKRDSVLAVWNPEFQRLSDSMPDTEIIYAPDEDHPKRPLIVIGTWPDVL